MKAIKTIFIAEVEVEFTGEDIAALMQLSAGHYDFTCKMLSEPGGLIYGLNNEFRVVLDPQPETVKRFLKFREIDLLAKVCEIGDAARLMCFSNMLTHINAEYERLNK